MDSDREIKLMNTFIVRNKRKRYAGFVSSPKRRQKLIRELWHFSDFAPSHAVRLSATLSWEGLLEELRLRGATNECYLISVEGGWDGKTVPLADAVRGVYASLLGTIMCCVPGRLAYFEGEVPDDRCILQRDSGKARRRD